jgi:hypothetical protein
MAQFSLTNASNWFKRTYSKVSERSYNSHNVLLGRVKKTYGFVGNEKIKTFPTTMAGGVGSGRLPTAGKDNPIKAIITSKKVYARAEIEREAIKAADGKDGSFVSQTKHSVEKAVEAFNWNMTRILLNSYDNGMLGKGDGSTAVTGDGSSGTPYLVKVHADFWNEAFWEEENIVNVGTETTELTIAEVVPSTRVVKLVGTSATLAAAVAGTTFTSAKIYLQNSKDNDPQSIVGALEKAVGDTLYGATCKRRFVASLQEDSSGSGVTTDMLSDDVLEIQKKCGKAPTLILASYAQYKKVSNLLEDKKEIEVQPRSEDLKGRIGFKALAVTTPFGDLPIVMERALEDERLLYLNDGMIEIEHRPDFGWFDDDGSVFMRKHDDDAYEARYGGYMEVCMNPAFHGYRKGLATT